MKKNIFTLTPDDIEFAPAPPRGIFIDDEETRVPTPPMKKLVSWRVLNWAQVQYKRWVEETYDDPSDVGNCAEDYRAWVDHAVALGAELGLVFEEVVTDVASPFEIRRFDKRCGAVYWENKK